VAFVQGHYVRYFNRTNSLTDCSILLKFRTEFVHVTSDTLEMYSVKLLRSQHDIRHQQ